MYKPESEKGDESEKVELNEAERQEKADQKQQERKQADILIDIAKAASLFHAPDSTCYADIIVGGCRQTWPVRNKSFKRWLSKEYFSRGEDPQGAFANIASGREQQNRAERP
jgi:hypothetical protein